MKNVKNYLKVKAVKLQLYSKSNCFILISRTLEEKDSRMPSFIDRMIDRQHYNATDVFTESELPSMKDTAGRNKFASSSLGVSNTHR